jgi:transposase
VLTLSPAVRIYLATGATNLRRSIDGLSALVRDRFTLDPQSGHLFLFRNRRGDRLKILAWDRSGFWILYKRLEQGHTKTRIGEAVSEKLEYVPASLHVIETARFKYACPQCHEGVIEAVAPPQAVEKSLAGEGLLAHVVVLKYVDHLPLYRVSRILLRERVDVSRATLCGWVADVAAALAPIGDQLRREITAGSCLHTDDTPVTILEEARGSIKGRLWTYLDPFSRQVVFDATPTHERDGPRRFSRRSTAIFRPTPTPATTPSMRRGGSAKSGAGRTRGGALSKP